MFYRRAASRVIATFTFILIALLTGCGRTQSASIERLTVLPIENLSSAAELNWLSRAGAAAVVYDLGGARTLFATQAKSMSDVGSGPGSRLLESYFLVRNGHLNLHATLEDLSKTKAVKSWDIKGDASAGLLPLANELARKLSPDARSFGTSNEKAFRYFGAAMDAPDAAGASQALDQAMQADSGFAAAYLEQAKLLAETGASERAREVAEAGQKARLDPIVRAELEYVAAGASGDATRQMKSLESLAAVTPADPNISRDLGRIFFGQRQFRRAALEYRTAAKLAPEDTRNWNDLGYALAWSGGSNGAREALRHYQDLAPSDLNALDSQGEVNYMLGDFKSADEFFEKAAVSNPAEYVKAAEARVMTGDVAGADTLFIKHLGRNANPQNLGAEYQIAQWQFLTGRRAMALGRMEKLAQSTKGDLQALALSQLALWSLDSGNHKAASDLASQATASAQGPQIRGIAALCQYIAAGDTKGSQNKLANAYTLVFQNNYRDALPLLESAFHELNPSADGQVRTLLAWAYVQAGAVDKAAALVSTYPLPLSSGDPLFAPLAFPRFLMVRGAVLQRQGKAQEAQQMRALYAKFGGQPTN